MPASPWLVSPQGAITVGALAILADGALGCAVQTALPPYTGFTTSELSLRVLRPAQVGTMLTAKGRLVHAGRRVALSEVMIEDAAGRLIAHGSSLCFVFPPDERVVPAPPPDLQPVPEEKYPTPHPYLRPVIGAVRPQEIWDKMSGLEVMIAGMTGELPPPPMRYLTGLRFLEATHGQSAKPSGF